MRPGRIHADLQLSVIADPSPEAGARQKALIGSEGRGVLDIEMKRYPGIDLVDILAASSTAPGKSKPQFAVRQLEVGADGQQVRSHKVTLRESV